jgi:hypothetical protein
MDIACPLAFLPIRGMVGQMVRQACVNQHRKLEGSREYNQPWSGRQHSMLSNEFPVRSKAKTITTTKFFSSSFLYVLFAVIVRKQLPQDFIYHQIL